MARTTSSSVGKRGTLVIPVELRRRFGLTEGTQVIVEETDEGILLRPAVSVPIEIYSDRRKAELILANAVDEEDRARARDEVRELGLDPDEIEREGP
ncbi:MAG TPA: AbrB/MazE/SpoVT family DNA-binding domain-containing protein [Trueperaceae bacterium]|nr:AbrB/MazE/SpoVT family DNA-binding domain-containing protein [Trueperaceae bacterium]